MSEAAELIELPSPETAMDVYSKPKGLEPWLDKIRAEVSGHAADLTTKKGRDAIASRAFKVRKIKTALDNLGKEQVDRLKDIPKKIDAERKRMRDTLDALADEVRKPLTEWEQAEEHRLQKHREAIEAINTLAANVDGRTADALAALLASVEAVAIGEKWEEFESEAARAKDKALTTLRAALAAREQYEAEQAELTRLRAEAEERRKKDEADRIAREAAEAATKAAEARAQAERDAAAKREADAKAAQQRAEREAAEAVERQKQAEARAEAERLAAEKRAADAAEAARVAEIDRQKREAQQAAEEQRRREADTRHKAAINTAALSAFVQHGLPEECAKQAVILIAKGLIPAVRINY